MLNRIVATPLVRPESLAAQTYDALAGMLMSGELRPGDRMSMRDLAERLEVSVMPVRDAVARLATHGALAVSPNRAVMVPLLSRAEFRDLTETRILNETRSVWLAASRVSAADLRTVKALDAAFNVALDAADGRSAVRANKALHFAAYAISGSPVLQEVIRMLWLKAGPILNFDLEEKSRRRRNAASSEHHGRLIAALGAGDAEAAAAAVEADITSAAEFILSRDILRP